MDLSFFSFLAYLANPIADPVFYAVAIPAVLITGIGKGGFGGSVAMLGTPLVALAASPIQAAAILLPILCAMDLFSFYAYRKKADLQALGTLVPGALAGVLVGTLSFRYLDDDIIRIMVGAITLAFLTHRLVKARAASAQGAALAAATPSVVTGSFWGTLSGFTSFIAHAGGPPAQIYLLPLRMDKTLLVGTMAWFFCMVNYAKLIPYGFLGQFSAENIGTSLILAPLAPIGVFFGVWLHKQINEAVFFRIIYAALFVVGLKLIFDGIRNLIA